MRAIGIDLGTTNSLAAIAGKEMKVLPTHMGEPLTPSVVSFVRTRKAQEGEMVVGRQAVSNAARAPEDTIFSIKRLMGAVYGEERMDEAHKHINYRIANAPPKDDPDQGVRVLLGNGVYSPIDISAMILKQVRSDAEQALGEAVTHAVITVPAYFLEHQRDATRKAAEQAGLKVLKIIDEPTAAAIFFGLGKEEERHRVLVYDFGGGTFDISIIQMTSGQYQVLVIEGDRWLGGDDFDRTIIARMIEWVKQEYDVDLSGDKNFLGKAKEVAEKAKIALTVQQSADIFVPFIAKIPNVGVVDIEMAITREEFEEDIRSLVDKTIALVNKALRDQNFIPPDITEVLMVGGTTALPLVQRAVSDLFGREKVKRHVNPMECVALGAALLAESYELKEDGVTHSKKEETVTEVTAMHLGIAAVRGNNPDAFVPIIEKGTPYPLAEPKRQIFYPVEENQRLIRVPVYEGLNQMASLNEQAGVIEIPLEQGISTSNAVEVSFNFDHNRVLTVGIRVVGTDINEIRTLQRDRPRVVHATKEGDNLVDDWREDLQPSVRTARQFLDTYGAYMEEEDRKELRDGIIQGEQALEANNQADGARVTLLLHNKLMGSGTASLMFIAERAMQDASPEITGDLASALASIRAAYIRHDTAKIGELSNELRMLVAFIMAQRATIRGVEDKQDLQNLLRLKE